MTNYTTASRIVHDGQVLIWEDKLAIDGVDLQVWQCLECGADIDLEITELFQCCVACGTKDVALSDGGRTVKNGLRELPPETPPVIVDDPSLTKDPVTASDADDEPHDDTSEDENTVVDDTGIHG